MVLQHLTFSLVNVAIGFHRKHFSDRSGTKAGIYKLTQIGAFTYCLTIILLLNFVIATRSMINKLDWMNRHYIDILIMHT